MESLWITCTCTSQSLWNISSYTWVDSTTTRNQTPNSQHIMSHYSMTNDRTTYSNVVHFRTAHVEHKWILSRCNKRKMHCMYNHAKEDTDTTYLMPHQCGDWWGLFVKLQNISAKLYHNTYTIPINIWCTDTTPPTLPSPITTVSGCAHM